MRRGLLGLRGQARYRFRCGRTVGPVRDTRAEAMDDAIAAGCAEYDSQYRVAFLTVPARIDTLTAA